MYTSIFEGMDDEMLISGVQRKILPVEATTMLDKRHLGTKLLLVWRYIVLLVCTTRVAYFCGQQLGLKV